MPDVAYDHFADIYDVWVAQAPVTNENLPFYVERYVESDGLTVELGVGNGRILVAAARAGAANLLGVDSSGKMLALAQLRIDEAGVGDRITLQQADFRDFSVPEPAALIAIPFHTIGHLVSLDDKRAGLAHIARTLRAGGRLVLDHFVFDPEYVRNRNGVPFVHAEYTDPTTGRDCVLWVSTRYDMEAQSMRVICWTDELDADDGVVGRQYRRMDFSWIEPDQMRTLLNEAGFEVESCFGDYEGAPLSDESREQVWIARKV